MSELVKMRSVEIRKGWFIVSDLFALCVIWSNVICDKAIGTQIKAEADKNVVGVAMLFCLETVAVGGRDTAGGSRD